MARFMGTERRELLLTLAQQVESDNPMPAVDDDFGVGTELNHRIIEPLKHSHNIGLRGLKESEGGPLGLVP